MILEPVMSCAQFNPDAFCGMAHVKVFEGGVQ